MKPVLESWLNELRADGLQLTPNVGAGANENLWCVSWPSLEQPEVDELVSFLQSAVNIRRELAAAQPFRPVPSMLGTMKWRAASLQHGLLRQRCTAIPRQSRLVHDPREIVAAFVRSPYRHGIPWSELEVVPGDPSVAPGLDDKPALCVWSVTLV